MSEQQIEITIELDSIFHERLLEISAEKNEKVEDVILKCLTGFGIIGIIRGISRIIIGGDGEIHLRDICPSGVGKQRLESA